MIDTYKIDQKRWAGYSIFEQMGNIYGEVGRSLNAKKRCNRVDQRAAMFRAIDLFDDTVASLIKARSPRAKEVLRAKEQYLMALLDENAPEEAIASLDRYFMQFAVAARLNR